MKCYVIILSKKYPTNHTYSGEKTYFHDLFLDGSKKHTIRLNYDLWQKRFRNIDNGNAYISLRQWSDKPFRSKQIEICKLTTIHGIGLQKITITGGHTYNIDGIPIDKNIIATNDGLTLFSFLSWFKEVPHDKELAVIHFTNFRYKI